MPQFFTFALTILLVLSDTCGSAPINKKENWSIKFTTSGGFAGIGTGNLNVDSKGNFRYEQPGPPTVRKGCESQLKPKQLEAFDDAVAQTNPREWNRPDLNVAAPDAFGYKLELRLESKTDPITVQWYDNTRDKLPSDLKQLSDLLRETMKSACRP